MSDPSGSEPDPDAALRATFAEAQARSGLARAFEPLMEALRARRASETDADTRRPAEPVAQDVAAGAPPAPGEPSNPDALRAAEDARDAGQPVQDADRSLLSVEDLSRVGAPVGDVARWAREVAREDLEPLMMARGVEGWPPADLDLVALAELDQWAADNPDADYWDALDAGHDAVARQIQTATPPDPETRPAPTSLRDARAAFDAQMDDIERRRTSVVRGDLNAAVQELKVLDAWVRYWTTLTHLGTQGARRAARQEREAETGQPTPPVFGFPAAAFEAAGLEDPRRSTERGAAAQSYEVRQGDTLSGIARDQLGDAGRWPDIAALNGLEDPDAIRPGQSLRLPEREAPADQ